MSYNNYRLRQYITPDFLKNPDFFFKEIVQPFLCITNSWAL